MIVLLVFAAFGAEVNQNSLRDFDNRREGTTIKQDALEDLALVSVHRYVQPFDSSAPMNVTLKVRFYVPPEIPDPSKVFVEAVELQDSFHYFMEAKPVKWKTGQWNVFAPWPTKDVIDSLPVHSDNLGVRAGLQEAGAAPLYFPVDVYDKQNPSAKQSYTFDFSTGQDLQSLQITVTNKLGTSVKLDLKPLSCNADNKRPGCVLFPAGTSQVFSLDMSQLPEGEYNIHLVGHIPKTSKTTSLVIRLYHHP